MMIIMSTITSNSAAPSEYVVLRINIMTPITVPYLLDLPHSASTVYSSTAGVFRTIPYTSVYLMRKFAATK